MPHAPTHEAQQRYELLERIGVGGMAEVFSARVLGAHGFAKQVALKRILPEHAAAARFQRRLLAEARIAATLSHSNIVSVFDCGRFGESLYLLQPNLKEGAGGLRDYHCALWVARAVDPQVRELPGAAHLGPQVAPERVANELARFFSGAHAPT